MMNSIPNFFYQKLMEQYGDEVNRIIDGLKAKRKTTFRVNTIKSNCNEIEDVLTQNRIHYRKVNWYEDAYVLEDATENEIKRLSIYDEGKIYLQSLSSMLPAIIMQPEKGESILDMCSAPGGKTTQMAALSSNGALITACEKNKIRAERLKYNIEKQGANKISALTQDARTLSEYFSFDKILLDSPCSGSGTLDLEDEKMGETFTEELVNRSVKTQFQLLQKAITLLKPGGELVYSTCSILKEENEENVKKFLKNKNVEIVPLNEEKLVGIPFLSSTIEGTITVCPTELYEGFFVAKIRKIMM